MGLASRYIASASGYTVSASRYNGSASRYIDIASRYIDCALLEAKIMQPAMDDLRLRFLNKGRLSL